MPNETLSSTNDLFADIAQTPAGRSLLWRVEAGEALTFSGITASARPFFAALLLQHFPTRPMVVVAENLKAQESFQQDLETWLQTLRSAELGARKGKATPSSILHPPPSPLYYPAWEVFPHQDKLPHADVISDRLQTLIALTDKPATGNRQPAIIVASVTALLQRTFAPGDLQARTRTLNRGDQINPLDLIEWLEEQGYEAEAQVSQKGEIALRGGIVDVFPPTSPWPVRLEFFGDELESLREFDPLTQISREEIVIVTLPPAGELGILKHALARGLQPASASEIKTTPVNANAVPADNVASAILADVEPGFQPVGKGTETTETADQSGRSRRTDAFSGLLEAALHGRQGCLPPHSEGRAPLATLLDYLPRETIFLLCDPEQLAIRAEEYAQQIPSDDAFLTSWPDFVTELNRRGFTVLGWLDDAFPLTPALSPGERENRSQFSGELDTASHSADFGILGKSKPDFCSNAVDQSSSVQRLSPLPGGEGQGEGKISGVQNHSLTFSSLDAFRPLAERAPEPQIAEAQRREFFTQIHRWLRQGYAVHVFCNNDGERQRFEEIWAEIVGQASSLSNERAGASSLPDKTNRMKACLTLHIGSLSRGFFCDEAKLVVVTDAEIFGRYKIQRPRRLKSPHALAARSALDIDFTDLEEGDLVVHLQYGIGKYLGLKNMPVGAGNRHSSSADQQSETECLVIEYAAGDATNEPPKLYVPVSEAHLVSKYVGAGKASPPLNTLGGTRWAKAKEQTEKAVRDIAAEMLRIQAVRETQAGHACKPDTQWQREFESAFIYEETPDQVTAIAETKADQERAKPMDRLICGDVGFGKTEVAIRASFKTVMDGKQVAILVPTTVLAQQHFNNFRERMADYPIRVELLSRFRTKGQQARVVKDLAAGAVDIVIGTHRIVQEDIAFKDLGLVVIDEEQRFGVLHKEKFKRLRTMVDVLTLSATPIPRTLYLALTGARDMSTIQTPPHDRLPVETIVTQYDERIIRDAIQREINRGGQVFFLHNRVITIQDIADRLKKLCPDARIVIGHGQMHADELEEVMAKFVNGGADVLLSTTIIESGLDIPNANTIIIDRADRFGLSDLYQLRGRVGRYKHQAYAYLLLPRHARLLTDVRKRISAMKQYSTLGSGFKIAMRDLEIRGAGNLLGAEQSGHITAVGFELYCQLLKQSVGALKGEKVKPRVEVRVALDFLDADKVEQASRLSNERVSASIQITIPKPDSASQALGRRDACPTLPHNYVTEPHHRIEIYRKLAQATDKAALDALQKELRDRFGPLPEAAELLLAVGELKILASEKAVTTIEVEEDKLKLTKHGDFITLGGKFPRLTKKEPKARLKEIKRLLLAI